MFSFDEGTNELNQIDPDAERPQDEINQKEAEIHQNKINLEDVEIHQEEMTQIDPDVERRQNKINQIDADVEIHKEEAIRKNEDHPGNRFYLCSHCNKVFLTLSLYEAHSSTHEAETSEKSEQGGNALDGKSDFNEDQIVLMGEKRFLCEYCKKGFKFLSDLIRHERGHTGEKPYKCGHCETQFTRLTSLIRHQKVHTGEQEAYECETCKKTFTRLFSLIRHQTVHTGERPYTCEVCDKGFTQLTSFKAHQMMHTGETPFTCEHCQKGFTRYSTLFNHLRTHSDTGEKSEKSKKGLKHLSKPPKNKKINKGVKPHQCGHCEKSFARNSTLFKHLQTHSEAEEKSDQIHQSKKGFKQLSKPKRNLKIIPVEKPYKCSNCKKSFARYSTLFNHLRTHRDSGEKSDKSHQSKEDLKQSSSPERQTINTGEKIHKCIHCNKEFARRCSLIAHQKWMHRKLVVSVTDCLL